MLRRPHELSPQAWSDKSEEGVSCWHESGKDALAPLQCQLSLRIKASSTDRRAGVALQVEARLEGRSPAWGRAPQRQAAPRPGPRQSRVLLSLHLAPWARLLITWGHGPPHLCSLMALCHGTQYANITQKFTEKGRPTQ